MSAVYKPRIARTSGSGAALAEDVLPATWFYDHAELKAELKAIRKTFPNMNVTGLAANLSSTASFPGHRDPLMTARFVSQFACALTYLAGYTERSTSPETGHPIEQHRAMARRLGASISKGALMSAHLAMGGTTQDLENRLRCRRIRLHCISVPMPVSALLRGRR